MTREAGRPVGCSPAGLFSYTVNPQTALHVGYGRQGLNDPLETRRDLVTAADGFFLKLGYAWRP